MQAHLWFVDQTKGAFFKQESSADRTIGAKTIAFGLDGAVSLHGFGLKSVFGRWK